MALDKNKSIMADILKSDLWSNSSFFGGCGVLDTPAGGNTTTHFNATLPTRANTVDEKLSSSFYSDVSLGEVTVADLVPTSIDLDPWGHAPRVSLCGSDHIMRVYDADGVLLVDIDDRGNIEFGLGYSPDETASLFWKTLANAFPGAVQPPQIVNWQHTEISIVNEETAEDAYERAMRIVE
jgi:hypothetical protein